MSVVLTFVEGLVSFLSPCTLPMIPIYVAYFTGEDGSRASAFARSLAFVSAFALVFVVMGAFAGSIGNLLSAHRSAVRVTCGALMVVLGVGYLGLFKLPFSGARSGRPVTGIFSAFLFGLAFSLGLTPCVGAFLASALLQAAAEGTALKGVILLLAYSAGLGIPFVLSALLIARLKTAFSFVKGHYRAFNVLSGVFLMVAGLGIAGCEFVKTPAPESQPTTSQQPVADKSTVEEPLEVTLTMSNFEAEVLKSDKPVLVDFWAPWCGPCRMMGPIISEIARERKGELKVGKVNLDENPDLAGRYGIMSIPTVILFKNGKVASKTVGFMPKEELLSALLK